MTASLVRRRLVRAVTDARLPGATGDERVVTDADITDLPAPAQRYLRFMQVIGRPRVWSFETRLRGRFRLAPDKPWMPCDAWQYNTNVGMARLFSMRLTMAGVLPMFGMDTYIDGRGHMHGKILGLITVADGTGPEFDSGELVTYLNDALLLAPSMLLGPSARWAELDDSHFDVSLTDRGRTVTGRVEIDADGRLTDFSTFDRWCALPTGLVRAPWTTPASSWDAIDGRRMVSGGRAVWHLPDGDFTYAEAAFQATETRFNVLPGALDDPARTPARDLAESVGGAVQIAGTILAAPIARRSYNRWGATPEECAAPMPGDDLVPDAQIGSTRAITVDARPEDVWPWLAQIGKDRGGLYSFDGLENLLGCGIHSANAIIAEHQSPEVGDLIRLGPDGYPCYRVALVDAPRSLVLVGADPKTHDVAPLPIEMGSTGATWQWELRPEVGGRTRLISRQRTSFPKSQWLLWHLVEPVGFVMERRMLRGIKARAERGREERVPALQRAG